VQILGGEEEEEKTSSLSSGIYCNYNYLCQIFSIERHKCLVDFKKNMY
jgi:hypothetical protein